LARRCCATTTSAPCCAPATSTTRPTAIATTRYSGKWLGAPPHVNFQGTGNHPLDPYADEKPLFTITAANLAEYAQYLPDGMKALLRLYPETFSMPAPSHRDFRHSPQLKYADLLKPGHIDPTHMR